MVPRKEPDRREPMSTVPITKILFLDVDGVLNRWRGRQALTQPIPGNVAPWYIELNLVELINWALSQMPDVMVVVSSTWRLHVGDADEFSSRTRIDRWKIHEDWTTDRDLKFDDQRKAEIEDWLSRHPEITRYAVLDDLDLGFSGAVHVRTDETVGLTYDELRRVLNILRYRLKEGCVVIPMKKERI